MWEPALSSPMSWNSMSCTTVPESQSIYLVEYKNANVPGAAKPDAFRPEKDIILNKVAEKYFDTLHCLYLLGKNKAK